VKLAVDKILHRRPDLCLSGINHGANHSINVIYSGTMSAAIEASIENIPSIGFSCWISVWKRISRHPGTMHASLWKNC
jgi:5'/3'-nucleotidase SurE